MLGLGHGLRDRPKVNGYWLRARPILLQARHTRSAKRETAGQGGRHSQGGRQGGAHRHVVRACALCSSWCSRKARSVVATRIARRGQTPPFAEFKHDAMPSVLIVDRKSPRACRRRLGGLLTLGLGRWPCAGDSPIWNASRCDTSRVPDSRPQVRGRAWAPPVQVSGAYDRLRIWGTPP